MKSKKGFTLVELLVVIIILIVVMLFAVNIIRTNTKKSKINAVKANSLSYIKAVNTFMDTTDNPNEYDAYITYSLSHFIDKGLRVSGTVPDSGFITVIDGSVVSSCLKYEKYIAYYKEGNISEVKKGTCSQTDDSFGIYEFAYTGQEVAFNVPYDINYKIEVWGAQGGDGQAWSNSIGGYGSYSVGEMEFSSGDILYINVGGQGGNNTNQSGTSNGGYNGGGKGYRAGGGGGATSIATKSGLLSTLENDKDKIIIVAGAGGGGAASRNSGNTSRGGHGGGSKGENGYKEGGRCANSGDNRCAIAGTQTSGGITTWGDSNATYRGTFGAGGPAGYFTIGGAGAMGGGGAGLYGGSGTYDSDQDLDSGGGAGGSGYIGNNLLTNKEMYCYGCPTSTAEADKTTSISCAENDPTPQCAKKGNGFVRISIVR